MEVQPMADKRKTAPRDDADRVMVLACAGFKHVETGQYIYTGQTCEVSAAEARDLDALNMARPLPTGVPKRARG
jgi:hypothetical protein